MVSLPVIPGVNWDPGASTPDVEAWLREASSTYGVPHDVLRGVLQHESSLDVDNARRPDFGNGGGLAQAIESTARQYGTSQAELRANPRKAVDFAAQLLKDNAGMFGGDYQKGAAAYFLGAGNVQEAERTGGSNWLPALDQIAAKYGQGTASDYLAAIGGGNAPSAGAAGNAALQTIPGAVPVGGGFEAAPVQRNPGFLYDMRPKGLELVNSGDVPYDAGGGGFVPAGQEDTPLRSVGTLRARLRGLEPDPGAGSVAVAPHTEDASSPFTLGLRGLTAAPGAAYGLADSGIRPLEDLKGLVSDATDPLNRVIGLPNLRAGPGGGISDAGSATLPIGEQLTQQVPTTPAGVLTTIGPGNLVKGARELRGLVTGAEEAGPILRGLEPVARETGVGLGIISDADRAKSARTMYEAAKAQGMSDEDIAGTFGQSALDLAKGGVSSTRGVTAAPELTREAQASAARTAFNRTIDQTGDVEAATAAARNAAGAEAGATRTLRSRAEQLTERMGPGVVEPKRTGWTITNAAGEAKQVETELPHAYADAENAAAGGAMRRFEQNAADQTALNDAIRTDEAGARARQVREGIDALKAEADKLDGLAPEAQTSLIADIAAAAKKLGDPGAELRRQVQQGDGEPDTVNAATNRQPPPKQTALPGLEATPEARTLWDGIQSLYDEGSGAVGGVRTLAASGDMGHILRQGQTLGWANPKVWKQMAVEGTKAFLDADYAAAKQAAMRADPEFAKAEKAGLKIYEYGDNVASEARAPGFEGLNSSRVSQLLEDLPHVAGGERSLAVALNHQGFEVFKQWSKGIDDPKQLAALADVINHARGFSAKGGTVALVSKLNALFSAQYTASRFNVLADPFIELAKGNTKASKLAATNLLSMAGANVGMLGLMGLTGSATGRWSVNANPLSSDFGQLRVGNTRFDTLGGFGPLIKTVAKITAATGVAGEDAQSQVKEINQSLLSFFENKQAPVFGMLEKYIVHGQVPDFKDPRFWTQMVTPMLAFDVYDAVKGNEGADKLLGIPAAVASGAGAGASTYQNPQDHADALAQQLYPGRKYDDLSPIERARVVSELPEEAQRKGKERFNTDLAAQKTAAGYDNPSADRHALDRAHPEIDAQDFIINGGPLSSLEAIDLALQSGVKDRDIRLAGLKRAVNQDDNSHEAWLDSRKPINWYLNEVVPENAQTFIDAYAKDAKNGAVWKKADGSSYTYDQLPPDLKTKVSSAIKAQALDPEMAAWLAWWGQRELPKPTNAENKKINAEFDKITAKYGSKEPETLTKAVIAGITASN